MTRTSCCSATLYRQKPISHCFTVDGGLQTVITSGTCAFCLRSSPRTTEEHHNNKKTWKKISKCLYKNKNTTHKWHIRFWGLKSHHSLTLFRRDLLAVPLINICDKFSTNPEPHVNQAQVLTRHLQPLWPCCSSSFHHFHSPSPCVIAQVWVTASKQLH